MPAHRKPATILELNGAFDRNPGRQREDPTPNGDIGEAPAYLDDEQRKAWDEIVENHYDGVLCKAHRHMVEHTAKLIAESRQPGAKADKELRIALSALGMDPVNCGKLGIKNKEKPKPKGFTQLK